MKIRYMYKVSGKKKTWANIISLRPSEIAFIKFICKSTSSIIFIRSKQSPYIRLTFVTLTRTISKATNPKCLGLSRSYKNTVIRGPIFHRAETIRQIYITTVKKTSCSKLTFFFV